MWVVWLARPPQPSVQGEEKGRDSLAGIEISSHLFDESDAFARIHGQRYP